MQHFSNTPHAASSANIDSELGTIILQPILIIFIVSADMN